MSKITKGKPVVVVMGHIDHGKSTLLDYIRRTNTTEKEAGGITQHLSAYQIKHQAKDGERFITFLDTPGHAAFKAMRERGAKAADIAILVVSAEDGVKPQTLEALKAIEESETPYIVAISKIDKPNANLEKTKNSLAENNIFLEGYGGAVPNVPISSKTGEGVEELLETVLLLADTESIESNQKGLAEGVIVESHMDSRRGNAATLVIKRGTFKTGEVVATPSAYAPLRILENSSGEKIKEAAAGDPALVVGWSTLPEAGSLFQTFKTKKEAEEFVSGSQTSAPKSANTKGTIEEAETEKSWIPLVVKADTAGTLEAMLHEVKKLETERAGFKIAGSGSGPITEGDVKTLLGLGGIVVGFSVKAETQAKDLAERNKLGLATFSVIYKLSEWLSLERDRLTPKITEEESRGKARVLKIFNVNKDRQIIGVRVLSGRLAQGDKIKIWRRSAEVGRGKVVGLEHLKNKVGEVESGKECGVLIDSKLPIAIADELESLVLVEK